MDIEALKILAESLVVEDNVNLSDKSKVISGWIEALSGQINGVIMSQDQPNFIEETQESILYLKGKLNTIHEEIEAVLQADG